MKLKPYPEYKDSGVPWLGEVPEHWDILPNRAFFTEVNERNYPHEEMLSVTITRGVIRQQSLLAGSSKKDSSNQDKTAYKLVQPRDIAYNKMRAWQGAIGVSDLRGIISPAYVIMRLRESNNPRYFHYLFRTPHFAKEAERWSYGITSDMWSLRPEHFKMIYTPLPPLNEQSAIVRFLDHFDRRINHLIRAKRRLIALLNEQKQAIIHRTVTRGLNPNIRLKPSGVDWLGEVPEHWKVTALRHRYSVQLGKMLDAKRIVGTDLVPYLRNTDVQWDHIRIGDLPQMDVEPREYERFTVQPGDMLVCEGGDVGRSAFWSGEIPLCGFQKALHRVRPIDHQQSYSRFLFYIMLTASKLGIFVAGGSENTIAHLTCEKLRRHRFPFPPRSEQEEIAVYLDEVVNGIDVGIERANREIDLIREYRTRLIADVVTGKIDVREAAASLPDDTNEREEFAGAEVVADGDEMTEDADLEVAVEEAEA
jgi:type I restriction enzyme S subunit